MDNQGKDIFGTFDKIHRTFNESVRNKWLLRATILRYKQEIKKLEEQNEKMKDDYKKIDEEIEELSPLNQDLENISNSQTQCLYLGPESLLIQDKYIDNANEILKRNKDKTEKIIQEYTQLQDECKERLAETNPTYKILNEKQIDLKKSRFNILRSQYYIKIEKWKKKTKIEFQQKLFYSDVIEFAKKWLDHRKLEEYNKLLQESGKAERKYVKKMMEITAQIKEQQKTNSYRKSVQQKEVSDNTLGEIFAKPAVPKNYSVLKENIPKNSLDTLNHLFNPINRVPESSKINYYSNNYFSNVQHNVFPLPKANILDVKVIQSDKKGSFQQKVESMTEEEKSKALTAKLQKVAQNFRHRTNSRNRFPSFFNKERISKIPENKLEVQPDGSNSVSAIPAPNPNRNPNFQAVNGISQKSENLNILSQETSSALSLLSQESAKNLQSKLKEFKYDSERPPMNPINFNVINTDKNIFPKEPINQNNNFRNQNSYPESQTNNPGYASDKFGRNTYFPVPSEPNINQNDSELNLSQKGKSGNEEASQFLGKTSSHCQNGRNATFLTTPVPNPFSSLQNRTVINQNEETNKTDNVLTQQISNNTQKITDNQNVALTPEFSRSPRMPLFTPQSNQYSFLHNNGNSFKRQKLDNSQQELDPNAIEKKNSNFHSQYNFGGVPNFMMDNDNDMGFTTSYAMSPEVPSNIEMPFSNTNFAFGQTSPADAGPSSFFSFH